jgi:HK97 family phage prohead protease
MITKTIRTPVKVLTNDEGDAVGFEGYASVFDNIDLGGDKIIKGAFADTLAARYPQQGKGIPVYWNHDTDDPFKNLGLTDMATEDEHGLKVAGTIDTSTDIGKQVAKLLKEGRVQQMSFAYDIKDYAWVSGEKNDDGSQSPGYMELRKLDLFEVSICPIGMNQETEVSAKSLLHDQPDIRIKNTCQQLEDIAASITAAFEKIHIPAQPSTPPTQPEPHGTPNLDDAARRLQLLNL